MIGQELSKNVFLRNVSQIGISSTIVNFNDGACGFVKVMENWNL